MVHSAPKGMRLASNFHEDLIQVPTPLVDPAHRLRPPLTDLVCEICAEMADSVTNPFMTNIDPAFVKQVFDITQ